MLSCLRVVDLAIVEELELELVAGLNVVTGETGAGKSIVIGALELVLGGRGHADHVRSGAKCAEVEALFDISGDDALQAALAGSELSRGEELLVRRVVQKSGRTRAFINGRLATREQLCSLTAGLSDISSQHQHHSLTDPSTHLRYLDAFGHLAEQQQAARSAFEALESAADTLANFEARLADRAARENIARSAIEEIESLKLVPGEDEQLRVDRERLRHTETLLKLTGEAAELLHERDDSVVDALSQAGRRLAAAAALDPDLADLSDRLEAARAQLQDAARELSGRVHGIRPDPQALERAEERLYQLEKLKRRYGDSLQEVLEYLERCRQELEQYERSTETENSLEQEYERCWSKASRAARALSKGRRSSAGTLAAAISKELHTLGMGDAKIVVDVLPLDSTTARFQLDGARLGPSGMDRAEFLIAPNRGEAARPLHKIASGGELSRAMLAIKCVLADLGPAGMYAFDEVDSGVGGGMAEIIGRKIHAVAQHRQVLCVTHLPQIAVYADQHFKVEKSRQADRTVSTIRRLDRREQREEIARMLGGLRITDKTRAAAKELLTQARCHAA